MQIAIISLKIVNETIVAIPFFTHPEWVLYFPKHSIDFDQILRQSSNYPVKL